MIPANRSTVRRDANSFDGIVARFRYSLRDIGTQRRIRRQFDNAAVINGNPCSSEKEHSILQTVRHAVLPL